MIYVVWWLSQIDTEMAHILIELKQLSLPEYMLIEVDSRSGRSGRGRLWIGLPNCEVDLTAAFDRGGPLAVHLNNYGGIVIRLEDAPLLRGAPGILTDTALNLLK